MVVERGRGTDDLEEVKAWSSTGRGICRFWVILTGGGGIRAPFVVYTVEVTGGRTSVVEVLFKPTAGLGGAIIFDPSYSVKALLFGFTGGPRTA